MVDPQVTRLPGEDRAHRAEPPQEPQDDRRQHVGRSAVTIRFRFLTIVHYTMYNGTVVKNREGSLKEDDMTMFGEYVRELRERAGLTQTEVEQRAGLAQTTLSNIERGR